MGGIVNDLAGRGAHPGGGHHILGEGLGALDAGSVPARPETGDPGGPDRVGHPEHQRHLRPDDDQVGFQAAGQRHHGGAVGDVDVVLFGDGRCSGIAGRHRQGTHLRIAGQGQQQGMFTGTGSDYEDAHKW